MQYLITKARNTVTGEVVKEQDLSGHRHSLNNRAQAEHAAGQLAAKMTRRTGVEWQGFVESYTPTTRRG